MANGTHWQDAVDAVRPHVVRIRTPRGRGTGFHVVDPKKPVLMGVLSAYIANRATGVALPGLAVVRETVRVVAPYERQANARQS